MADDSLEDLLGQVDSTLQAAPAPAAAPAAASALDDDLNALLAATGLAEGGVDDDAFDDIFGSVGGASLQASAPQQGAAAAGGSGGSGAAATAGAAGAGASAGGGGGEGSSTAWKNFGERGVVEGYGLDDRMAGVAEMLIDHSNGKPPSPFFFADAAERADFLKWLEEDDVAQGLDTALLLGSDSGSSGSSSKPAPASTPAASAPAPPSSMPPPVAPQAAPPKPPLPTSASSTPPSAPKAAAATITLSSLDSLVLMGGSGQRGALDTSAGTPEVCVGNKLSRVREAPAFKRGVGMVEVFSWFCGD